MNNNISQNTGTVTKLLHYIGAQKKKLAIVFFLVILVTILNLWAPIELGKIIDFIANDISKVLSGSQGGNFEFKTSAFGESVAFLVAIYLLAFALNYVGDYIMAAVSEEVALKMRKDLSAKLNRLPLNFYDSRQKGDILSRATNDIEKVAESLREGLVQLLRVFTTVTGAVILMFYIYPILALVSIGVIICTSIVAYFISKRSRTEFSNYQKSVGEINGNIEEAFTGQLIIKAFNHEQQAIDDFEKINATVYKTAYKSQIAIYMVPPVARIIGDIGYATVAVISGYAVIQGRLTIGTVQAFIQYLYKSSEPIIEGAYILNTMQSAIAASKRLFEVLDECDEIHDTPSASLATAKGLVEFKNVKFGYTEDKVLMRNVNICLNAGDKVAIVGPTGAGKTTLVNLLMRFYEIQGGTISVDGIDIRTLSRENLRSNFGMVLQDTWLFEGTIRDNIAYSNLNASEEEIMKAAYSAHADHFIRTLPQGYQTIVNDDNTTLSQGQKQLLTIARVVLANPSILILDEATSSVDTRTEQEIQNAMDNLMKGRTSFVIAHRLSTIRNANLILVMNDGNIIEQGTHEQLLAQKGFYSDLYNSQFTSTI